MIKANWKEGKLAEKTISIDDNEDWS